MKQQCCLCSASWRLWQLQEQYLTARQDAQAVKVSWAVLVPQQAQALRTAARTFAFSLHHLVTLFLLPRYQLTSSPNSRGWPSRGRGASSSHGSREALSILPRRPDLEPSVLLRFQQHHCCIAAGPCSCVLCLFSSKRCLQRAMRAARRLANLSNDASAVTTYWGVPVYCTFGSSSNTVPSHAFPGHGQVLVADACCPMDCLVTRDSIQHKDHKGCKRN